MSPPEGRYAEDLTKALERQSKPPTLDQLLALPRLKKEAEAGTISDFD
jgi:hypothetical protein